MTKRTTDRARTNRKNPTDAELKLWSLLRDRRLKYKFRRQHPIGAYVVDFACPAIHLIVEVDGLSHLRAEQQVFDAEREEYLTLRGWKILRVPNDHVYKNLNELEAAIYAILEPDRF